MYFCLVSVEIQIIIRLWVRQSKSHSVSACIHVALSAEMVICHNDDDNDDKNTNIKILIDILQYHLFSNSIDATVSHWKNKYKNVLLYIAVGTWIKMVPWPIYRIRVYEERHPFNFHLIINTDEIRQPHWLTWNKQSESLFIISLSTAECVR